MTNIIGHVGCFIITSTLGKAGYSYQRLQERFLAMNGTEWTCRRSKAIYNIALALKGNDLSRALIVLRENSIAYDKKTLIPKGPEGLVIRRFLYARRPSVQKRLVSVMRFYTFLKLDTLSPSQRRKAVTAITKDYDGSVSLRTLRSVGESDTVRALRPFLPNLPIDREERVTEIIMRGMDASPMYPTSYYYSPVKIPAFLRRPGSYRGRSDRGTVPAGLSFAMSLMTMPWVPDRLDYATPCQEMRNLVREQQSDLGLKLPPFMGKIAAIQEPGCKARVVTMPSAFLQLSFLPLNSYLPKIAELGFKKESCVKDQTIGGYAMADLQGKGLPVYSVDLSSATDRFPRAYTQGVLDALGLQDYSDSLEEVCNKPVDGTSLGVPSLFYKVGQPMGLNGSFPMFHLSHLVFARTVESNLVDQERYNPVRFYDGTTFKILGDDIIWSDERLANSYTQRMTSIGVEVSDSKTFRGEVAEFAGFISIPSNRGPHIWRPYKYSTKENYVTNPISFLHSLGSKAKKLSRRWANLFEDYLHTIKDRDIALAPYATNEQKALAGPYRLDNSSLINICNNIARHCYDPLIPDLSGNTKINRIPLFRERGMFDYSVNDPHLIVRNPQRIKERKVEVSRAYSDPLMSHQRQERIRKGQDPLAGNIPSTKDKLRSLEVKAKERLQARRLSEEPHHQPGSRSSYDQDR